MFCLTYPARRHGRDPRERRKRKRKSRRQKDDARSYIGTNGQTTLALVMGVIKTFTALGLKCEMIKRYHPLLRGGVRDRWHTRPVRFSAVKRTRLGAEKRQAWTRHYNCDDNDRRRRTVLVTDVAFLLRKLETIFKYWWKVIILLKNVDSIE